MISKNTANQSLLAEGTYGCTFSPPLPCKKVKRGGKEAQKQVGKLTRKTNADFELDIAAALRNIPSWEKYFILSTEDTCSRKELEKLYKEYKGSCDFLRRVNPSQLTHLISPYGGITLRHYPLPSTFSVAQFLEHLGEGIEKMHSIGYGHFDIHDANILIDEKGVARLIDFGKSMKGDEMNLEKIQKLTFSFTPSFIWQAPELSVMNAIQEHIPEQLAILRTMEKKGIFRDGQTYLGLSQEYQKDNLEKFWNFSETAQGRSWDRFFRHHWKKFDVWSLGVIGLTVLKTMLSNTRYIETTWKKEGDVVKTALRRMIVSSPKERADIEEVLRILKRHN